MSNTIPPSQRPIPKLKELLDGGQCEDRHLFTAALIGIELTSTNINGQVNEAVVAQEVNLCAWTQESAREHSLIKE